MERTAGNSAPAEESGQDFEASRDEIHEQLQQGLSFEQICTAGSHAAFSAFGSKLLSSMAIRAERRLRWERIAVRLYGDASPQSLARALIGD